ncbi:hypothetical protein M422DRAFT_30062 [Sphaerobolus stellatus SS14]|uniref:Glutamate--tRNA ligase, mitochondrial n=1 Tax=Sphaerobolus stellatus (strain SS14) TaxID=990650 RepID=A0A0C9UQJ6_SPHS4|nr:hypothetical protein M422DRAFT_30062 [Sphaerobolus stellatus SS14]
MVLLRFAPSPTGALHLGGLRTALLNHLVARKLGGKWLLRIEDTDNTRLVAGSVDNIRHALDWAGLHYDFGPGVGGPHGPYFQSERLGLYHSYAKKLLEARHAYRCFCTPSELSEIKDRFHKMGSTATYDRRCLHLTEEEVALRVKAGKKSVIRIHDASVPERSIPPDLIFGVLKNAQLSLPTDPILLKSDQFPTYHLASVVDDHEMGITHVLRGEEWLPSLPLHLSLYACLSMTPPQFGHLPLLLNPDGSKMSKRMGDVQVAEYISKGWEPEAILNWLALVGWGNRSGQASGKEQHGKSIPDVFTLEELERKFDLSALTSRRGILERTVLTHLNKEHIKRKVHEPDGLHSLVKKAMPILSSAFIGNQFVQENYVGLVVIALGTRLVNILDIATVAPYFFVDPDWFSDTAMKMKAAIPHMIYKRSVEQSIEDFSRINSSEWTHAPLATQLQNTRTTLNCSSKEIMSPLRHSLTGMKDGPSIINTIELLGKERTLERLQRCATANFAFA